MNRIVKRSMPAMLAASAWLGLAASVAGAEPATPYRWASVPFGGGGFVDGFLYHPTAPGLLYARTDIGGMYRYDRRDHRWIALLDHLARSDGDLMGVLSMAIDPHDPARLYAACGEYLGEWARAAALLRSNDQGVTWEKTELPFRLGGNDDGRGTGDRLQVDPNLGTTLLLGSNKDGLWKSVDGGRKFARIGGAPTSVSLVLFDPRSGAKGAATGTIWVGSADGPGGLYVSHDGGASFALAPGAPRQTPQHAVFAADGTLYVAFAASEGKAAVNPGHAIDGGVWKLDPAGGRWTDISPQKPGGADGGKFGYSGIDVDPAHPGTLVVSTLDRWGPGDDIFLSRDGGAHWTPLGPQSRHDAAPYPWLVNYTGGRDAMGHWIADVRINPSDPDEMVYGTGYGLWMTHNLGAAGSGQRVAFDFAVANLEETAVLGLAAPADGARLYAAMGDVAGAGWSDLAKTPGEMLFAPMTENSFAVDYAGRRPAFFARTVSNAPHAFLSGDGGANWLAMRASPYTPQDAHGNWHGPGTIAVSAGATFMVWAPEKDGAWWSADKGKSWTPTIGWPAARDRTLVPVADKALEGVFYLYSPGEGRILVSADGGKSFNIVTDKLPRLDGWQQARLAVTPGRLRDLWLIGPYGLVHSASADKPLAAVKSVQEAWALGFGKAAPGQTYPAIFLWGKVRNAEGLWRSDDEGGSWVRINDAAHQFGRIHDIAGDPREFGTVFIAAEGRGVLVGRPAG